MYFELIRATVTNTLNTSLHTHAQTLALLALQRSTTGLPCSLISPGRTFLKRGALIHLENASEPREREFLLFSDCLLWLAPADGDAPGQWEEAVTEPQTATGAVFPPGQLAVRPPMIRRRSKSEAALPRVPRESTPAALSESTPGPSGFGRTRSVLPPKPKKKKQLRIPSVINDERWIYRGSVDLIDMDVVVSAIHTDGEERRIEVLSPQGSFVLYTGERFFQTRVGALIQWCSYQVARKSAMNG
jgi:FYVE, RhoGEF and PH domain containing 5/6